VVVRDEVEEVFLEVRPGAADGVDLIAADHLGERPTEFGGAHRAGEGHEHPAAVVDALFVRDRGVAESRGVEVSEVLVDEISDGHGVASSEVVVRGVIRRFLRML
jgi:hypothetical protein